MDVILLAPTAAAQPGEEQQGDAPARVVLARFPAHSALLSNSAVLRSRVSSPWADTYHTFSEFMGACQGLHVHCIAILLLLLCQVSSLVTHGLTW